MAVNKTLQHRKLLNLALERVDPVFNLVISKEKDTMVSRLGLKPPNLGRLRLACVEDAPTIKDLLTEPMCMTFRIGYVTELIYLIENSVLAICQLDVNEDIVGCLLAREYPLIPSVHPQSWEEYLWTKYKAVELNSRNTLFIHLMCWNPVYARECVDSMLKSLFMHDAYVKHIAMVKSCVEYPLLVPGQSRAEASFRKLQAMEKGMPGDKLPALFIADRTEVSPGLKIRRAVEEDNDDIIPLIERYSPRLREQYGEYYVSELISRHPESERVLLVCEAKELAVGVLCLNTLINFEALEESFELAPFSGLRKITVKPRFKQVQQEADSNVSFTPSQIYGFVENNYIERSRDTKTRVTWQYDDEEFRSFNRDNAGKSLVDSHVGATTHVDILNMLEEDEELEFDIINIDTDLLRVPQLLTYDNVRGVGPAENIMKMLDIRRVNSNDKSKSESPNFLSSVTSVYKPPEPTRYVGSPNAFLLELFAINPDYDERCGFNLLEAAFDLFPDMDYCIICLPSNHPSYPLLEHFTLVTPVGSRMRFINETLYVAHVNSVKGDMKVRPGEGFDLISSITDIFEHAPRSQAIIDLFETSLTSHTLQGYVFLSENQPVGMVVLGPLEDGPAIRTQFDLEPEPRRPGTDGAILAGVVSPILEPHSRWLMRELLRLSQYSTLFWMCRLFGKGESSPSRNLMSLASHMTPVHPRQVIPNLSGNKDLDRIFSDVASPFALWVVERPLSGLPKVYVNNSIVVVGASRTGLAFLETLILGPTSQYLTFSNLTLISEHGLPTVSECLKAADTCVPRDGRYTDRYLKSVPFYYYLDVLAAVMTSIDRKKKCISLKCGGVKYYDQLVLACGQQFQHPDYLHEPLELVKETECGKPCERMLMDDPKYQPNKVPLPPEMPENVMVINSLFQANTCLRRLLHMVTDYKDAMDCLSVDNPVVVYGECIEAYSCIAALLELGISAEMIVFVEPYPPEDPAKLRVNCYNNETVDERVQANLEQLGITVYRKSYLSGWRQRDVHVSALNLMSPLQAVCLPCFALFYYGLKAIDIYAFRAINESGLVYDGGLVVEPSFETNDPCVFGAGTCTKYSRRLYANPQDHRYYCSEDVGEELAKLFLRKLDPFVMGETRSEPAELLPRFSSSLLAKGGSYGSLSSATRIALGMSRVKWQPVMKFESPIFQLATLPGPLFYMNLRKPGIEIPMAVELSLPHQGHTLITDKRGNYCRLQLSALHCVSAVTCLSKKPFSQEVFSKLYGKQEAYFDKLLTRFQMKLIEDLFDFFAQPWKSALYQETFEDVLAEIREQRDVVMVHELVRSKYTQLEKDIVNAKAATKCGTCNECPRIKGSSGVDIPTECGQSAFLRSEAADYWKIINGEGIVITHLTKYLNRNSVINPHYATPKHES